MVAPILYVFLYLSLLMMKNSLQDGSYLPKHIRVERSPDPLMQLFAYLAHTTAVED